MKTRLIDITLEQPLILSQQAASAGAHQSLDYVPGATLLGHVAGRLYAALNADDAWTVFHSGRLRFGDALPHEGGESAWPVPLSWHSFKGEAATASGRVIRERVFDRAHVDDGALGARQPVQMRQGYVTESGRLISPLRTATLKTAIDPHSGTAAEGQLFGYESLAAGSCFCSVLQADDDVDEGLWQRVLACLNGEARLGRSRSAQYGRVRLSSRAAPAVALPAAAGTTLTLWLTADLTLSEMGQPRLAPAPALLGLPDGTRWEAAASFIRTRRYTRYNAYRRHSDPERQVICRGSVLRYTLPAAPDAALLQRLQQGIGTGREAGLGQVLVNPVLLQAAHPVFAAATTAAASPAATSRPAPMPDSALLRTLRRRMGEAHLAEHGVRGAEAVFDGLCARVQQARRYLALPAHEPLEAVPGRSQFGRLKEVANRHRDDNAGLWDTLFGGTQGVLLPRKGSGWDLHYGPGAEETLGAWLQAELADHRNDAGFSRLIGVLATKGVGEHWSRCCAATLALGQEVSA